MIRTMAAIRIMDRVCRKADHNAHAKSRTIHWIGSRVDNAHVDARGAVNHSVEWVITRHAVDEP